MKNMNDINELKFFGLNEIRSKTNFRKYLKNDLTLKFPWIRNNTHLHKLKQFHQFIIVIHCYGNLKNSLFDALA